MKSLSKYNFYRFIPAINIILSLSAGVLIIFVLLHLKRPYYPVSAQNWDKQIKITAEEQVLIPPEIPGFDEEIFKRKQLFNLALRKNKPQEKKEFTLLGISIGSKNIAMLKDTRENKDYYCREGDKIGAFNIKQILKDKVILESEGSILVISQ